MAKTAEENAACGEYAGHAENAWHPTMAQRAYLPIKRGLDVVICSGASLALAPLMGGIALAIKLDSPGPVLFKQKRVGKDKKLFEIWKFRTMRTDTPRDVPTHLLQDPEAYITRTGKILRKTSLDELPQLLQCVSGELSLIGPRPALWNQEDLIAERDRYGANSVKPGITGWAQINGRDELEISVKARFDGEYVSHFGLIMDMKCFFGTIGSILTHDGVVEGGTGAMKESRKPESTGKSASAPKSKFLILTNHSYMLYQFRRELIQEMLRDREVVIGVPFGDHVDDFKTMGCRMIDTPLERRSVNPLTDLGLFRQYREILREEKPDKVITYSIKPNVYGGIACQMQHIPCYVNVQGLGTAFEKKGLAEFVTVLYRTALRKAEVVFFENKADARAFLRRRIVKRNKVRVLHGAGVDLARFACADYPSEGEGIHFLYLGRIMKEKGMDEFFAAARALKSKYGDKVIFDLVGFFEDDYKETVEEMEAQGIVQFHGFQEDPRPWYAKAHCVVMPSYHEGMSNVLLEAAATGRAVITTNIPGCREAVKEDVSGLLCPARDSGSLQAAMEVFLRKTPDERRQMGQAGRKRMKKYFDKKEVVRETMKTLDLLPIK